MIRMAALFLMTLSAAAFAMTPGTAAMFSVDALFILVGLFVLAVATVNAVQETRL